MSNLLIKKSWLEPLPEVGDAHDDELLASTARFQILIGRQSATENKINGIKSSHIEIPVYYLAEWIAENWWVMLYEPRKDEGEADPGFESRHSIVSAQHGFPLPALSIIPFGRSIRLNCSPRKAAFANIQFTSDAFGDASTESVESTLTEFLRDTDQRLKRFNVENTNFQRAWSEIVDLSGEERAFCELLGSLGVLPNRADDELCSAVESLFAILGPRATRDYCLAATPKQVVRGTKGAKELTERLMNLKDTKLDVLLRTDLPAENFSAPSWRRGIQAAKNLREKLKIDPKDEAAATKIFDDLDLDLTRYESNSSDHGILPYGGAIDRHDRVAKVALFQEGISQRRFAAGRAVYLSWVSETNSRRLITNAVTRDQQASRQFAAEILVPREYLEKRARAGKLSYDDIIEIASLRGAMPDVAFKQAHNAGIKIAAI